MFLMSHPAILLLLTIPLGAALYFLLKRKQVRSTTLLMSVQHTALKSHSVITKRVFRALFFISILILSLLVVTLTKPFRTKTYTKLWTEGVDIAIVLDVSESMEASDLLPTRILAAKSVIRDFVSRRPHDRIGLVIFGGEAIMKSPLTRDFDFLLNQVDDVRLRELKQGTAIGMGLANGISRLIKTESKNKVIILLTDGDSNVGAINPITAAHLAQQEGIRIYTIGIGKEDRVIIPIYSYDANGKKVGLLAQVPSYLNPELLKEISRITGGNSYMARDSGMLLKILQEIDRLEKTKIKVQPMTEREELFFYPACVATLLLFLYFLITETRYKRGSVRRTATVV